MIDFDILEALEPIDFAAAVYETYSPIIKHDYTKHQHQTSNKPKYHKNYLEKIENQKKHNADAKTHQHLENTYESHHNQLKSLEQHHKQKAKYHHSIAKQTEHAVKYHETMKQNALDHPSRSHKTNTHTAYNYHKMHEAKGSIERSKQIHHDKEALRHDKKAKHYAKQLKATKKKKEHHRKKKEHHLQKGHDTGHFAYPDHYAHHHPGYYNEWDALHDRAESIRRAQDIQNSAPFAIDEVDPENNSGFVLEQSTSYDTTIPHQHLQQYGHYKYPQSIWSTPQTDSPVCLPSVEMDRKPVHLGNTFATPNDDFSVGYMMPRFEYKEYREY